MVELRPEPSSTPKAFPFVSHHPPFAWKSPCVQPAPPPYPSPPVPSKSSLQPLHLLYWPRRPFGEDVPPLLGFLAVLFITLQHLPPQQQTARLQGAELAPADFQTCRLLPSFLHHSTTCLRHMALSVCCTNFIYSHFVMIFLIFVRFTFKISGYLKL